LIGIAGKDIFGGNTGRIGLAGDSIRDIKTRTNIITRIDIIIAIWISGRKKYNIKPNKSIKLIVE
jgi:hypothetical protein